jgi:hypothetical protein
LDTNVSGVHHEKNAIPRDTTGVCKHPDNGDTHGMGVWGHGYNIYVWQWDVGVYEMSDIPLRANKER